MKHIDNNQTTLNTVEYTLENLNPYTKYTITIVACTSKCSQSSKSLTLTTKIGKPSRISSISAKDDFENGNLSVNLTWSKPFYPGGPLDFYVLTISVSFRSMEMLYRIHPNINSCIITALNCDEKEFFFSIRAANKNHNISLIKGSEIVESKNCFANEWEKIDERYFYGDPSPLENVMNPCAFKYNISLFLASSPTASFIFLFLLLILITFLCNFSYNIYSKLTDMREIQILLPNGLDPDVITKSNFTFPSCDIDLDESCGNLENIKEESFNELELYENDNKTKEEVPKDIDEQKDKNQLEYLTPLISKSQTLNRFNKKKTIDKKKSSFSVPTSPAKQGIPLDYLKMYSPNKAQKNLSNSYIAGYLDMSGKTTNLDKKDINLFIQNSQLNNGYIQRNSINNSSGYVGFRA